jgi:hypothetical protein
MHLDHQRYFVTDKGIRRLIGLRPNPQLKVSGSKLGLVQDLKGRGDAVVGSLFASDTNIFHLEKTVEKFYFAKFLILGSF